VGSMSGHLNRETGSSHTVAKQASSGSVVRLSTKSQPVTGDSGYAQAYAPTHLIFRSRAGGIDEDDDGETIPIMARPNYKRRRTAEQDWLEEPSELHRSMHATLPRPVTPDSYIGDRGVVNDPAFSVNNPVEGQRIHFQNHPTVVRLGNEWMAISCHICGVNASSFRASEPYKKLNFFKGVPGFADHYAQKHRGSDLALRHRTQQLIAAEIAQCRCRGEV